jgi:trigger factor
VKSTVETLSPTRVRLAIEVPFTELQPALDAAYKKIGAGVKIPGFRPGKVPNRVIDQRVGRAAVLQEAINDQIPRLYSEAARENELKTVGQPEIDVTKLEDGTDFAFTAEVDVRPEITLPTLDGIAVSVDDAEVTDTDIDEQVEALRDRFGTLKGVERAVQTGDYVSLDLDAAVNGDVLEDGSAKGLSYEVGAADLIEGLDEAIVGKNAGETATFDADLKQGSHAGETAQISATVNSVKEKELPALDDDFAQLASEFDTIAELREDVKTRLGRVKVLQQGAQARDKLLEQLVDSADFPLPESPVKAEVDYREHDLVHSLGHDDALYERYLEGIGKTKDEYLAELREDAEKSVRAQFILDAIAEAKDVQVGDAELSEYLLRQAQRYGMSPQEFASQMVQGGNLPALISDVRRSKALATLLETAVVTDASGNTVDLNQLSPSALAEIAEEAADEPFDHDHDHEGHDHDHEGHDH